MSEEFKQEKIEPSPEFNEKKELYVVSVLAERQAESGERINEDAYVLYEDDNVLVAAVLDGATCLSSVTGVKSQNEQTGVFAAQTGAKGIEENVIISQSASELLKKANEKISAELLSKGIDAESKSSLELSNAQALAVRIDKAAKRISIALLGDAGCIIEYSDGLVQLAMPMDITPEDIEGLSLSQDIAREKNLSVKEILSHKDYREKINETMQKGRGRCNQENGRGVGVIDGRKNAEKYIKTVELNADEVRRIILLTDGMFLPVEIAGQEPDWKKMAKIIKEGGLEKLYNAVLNEKNSDPNFDKYPRFKKHDDATGILIEL